MKNILAIPGSLRPGSSNHTVLRFLGTLIAPEITYMLYDGLALIPPFDPAADGDTPPEQVVGLRNLIDAADAIIVCTPEYAFGVPGQLKNALDWTVSSGSFSGKPTALITASTSGEYAHAALITTLGALDARLSDQTLLLISFIRSKINTEGKITDKDSIERLTAVVNALTETGG